MHGKGGMMISMASTNIASYLLVFSLYIGLHVASTMLVLVSMAKMTSVIAARQDASMTGLPKSDGLCRVHHSWHDACITSTSV